MHFRARTRGHTWRRYVLEYTDLNPNSKFKIDNSEFNLPTFCTIALEDQYE